MSANSLLTNPESLQTNQNGHITPDQYRSLKSKLGVMPGWFTVTLLFALIIATAFLGGNTLTHSTPLAIIALVGVIIVTFVISAFLGNILGSLRMIHVTVHQVRGQFTWYTNRYAAVSNGRLLDLVDSSKLEPGDYIFTVMRGTNYVISAQRVNSTAAAPASNLGAPGITSADLAAAAGNRGGVTANPATPTDLASLKALLDKPLDFDPRLEPEKAAQHAAKLVQAMQNLEGSHPVGVTPQDIKDIQSRLIDQVKQLSHGQSIRNLINIAQDAEHLTQPKMDSMGIAQLDSALEQVGIRDKKALSANQSGRQTLGQRSYLVKKISSNLLWTGVATVIWLVISAYAVVHAKWTPLLAATGFFLLVLLMLLTSALKEIRDLLSGSVANEQGWVSKYTRSSHSEHSSTTYHYYKVNGNSYEVWKGAYDALIEGNYTLYFLPATRTVVNIEPVVSG